ncbi:MFS general substrate transporter [Corynespora cassiicola Philippines]|uniref:MFS general substrate transporter n=1 Tax=Corynespora cassiicola Philippines TaxID=1448308 RepID=A0A2T2NUI2_CORCC|nr:MFS general substrate transporter [Corynespora cassiicola Philippines]
MSKFIRDTSFGQFIRLVTRKRVLQFPEEQHNFQLQASYIRLLEAAEIRSKDESLSASSQSNKENGTPSDPTLPNQEVSAKSDEKAQNDDPFEPKVLGDGTIIVNWYGPDDPENPQNWTIGQKLVPALIVNAYTFAVYLGSSIFTGSYSGVMRQFGVSQQVVSLNLSMYVLAYGIGPLLWSPLSEIPSVGRSPLYIFTFAIFVILLVPTALVNNFPGLVVLRFLLGFFGSPCLATGAASLADMYAFDKLPYALATWAFVATTGPAVGPLLSGYSVPATSWRWSSWEMLWLSGPLFIAFFLLVPETSSSNILLRRAQRLRARTGQSCLKSQGEIHQSKLQPREVVTEALWRPIQTMILDPSIGFTALYVALIYGIYYSFFECFPIVYMEGYGFSLGAQGLLYLSISIGILVGLAMYLTWIRITWEPAVRAGNIGPPERRLIPALFSSFLLPIGLFLFAWTATPEIHWVVSTIGIAILSGGIFLIMQSIFLFLPLSYPKYTASVFSGNNVARSVLAAAIVHCSQPLYINLGVDRGVSLLGGLTVGCIAGIFALWYYGPSLRARSKFAG